jgi:hypothetical protein
MRNPNPNPVPIVCNTGQYVRWTDDDGRTCITMITADDDGARRETLMTALSLDDLTRAQMDNVDAWATWAVEEGEEGEPVEATATLAQCECDCNCAEDATTVDDGGNAVCAECAVYRVESNGSTTCSRVGTDGEGRDRCVDCESRVRWGAIQTGGGGNHCVGRCGCDGRKWESRERGPGNDWHVSYEDTTEDS